MTQAPSPFEPDRAGDALTVYIVAGEQSGDQLGFKLMQALRQGTQRPVRFLGVGGASMEKEGLKSLFPLSDIAVMGIVPVIKRLPTLLARIGQVARSVIESRPDILILIDSPDFTHRVARKARARLPDLKIIDYVSPTVWAWRSGRARTMRAYTDHVLALLPFEPAAYVRLHGPACTYVGHPLIERLDELRPSASEAGKRDGRPPVMLVLPGSRRSEIARLMPVFGQTVARLQRNAGPIRFVLPVVAHVEADIRRELEHWPIKPELVFGETDKWAAFRTARAALAASGTVTLELALSGVPMAVAYRVAKFEEWLRFLVEVPSIVLPNLIIGRNAFPEFIQQDCTPDALVAALMPLLANTPERGAQMAAFEEVDAQMRLGEGEAPNQEIPSQRAAGIVLGMIGKK